MKLPSLSIAAKLYTIFALLATATAALSVMAVLNARTLRQVWQIAQGTSLDLGPGGQTTAVAPAR